MRRRPRRRPRGARRAGGGRRARGRLGHRARHRGRARPRRASPPRRWPRVALFSRRLQPLPAPLRPAGGAPAHRGAAARALPRAARLSRASGRARLGLRPRRARAGPARRLDRLPGRRAWVSTSASRRCSCSARCSSSSRSCPSRSTASACARRRSSSCCGGAGVSREDAFALGLAFFAVGVLTGALGGLALLRRGDRCAGRGRTGESTSSNVNAACAVSCSQPRRSARSRGWRSRAQPQRSPAPPPSSLTIAAAPGRAAAVSRELARLGAPVTRARRARCCRCATRPGLAARLRRVPGVRGVGPAAVPLPDQVISQGVERIGADALQSRGLTGAGIRIADRRPRLRRQLAQPARQGAAAADADRRDPVVRPHERQARDRGPLERRRADRATARTSPQVVWDIAPGARYTFVNYHTQLELSQAVDWLVNGPDGKPRVDIVVHSNSFLDGPFDGTGVAAQAVNRAHDAGIFWANSAGNYARRHWEGVAGDPDKDGWADIGPAGAATSTFPLTANIGMGATLYWSSCTKSGVAVAGLERELPARRHRHGARARRSSSRRARRTPSRPAASVGYLPTATGTYGLRVQQVDAGRRLRPRDLRRRRRARRRGDAGVEHPDARRRARLVHGRRARLAGRRRGRLLLAGPDRGRAPEARCRRARLDRRLARASRWSARRPRRRTPPARRRC